MDNIFYFPIHPFVCFALNCYYINKSNVGFIVENEEIFTGHRITFWEGNSSTHPQLCSTIVNFYYTIFFLHCNLIKVFLTVHEEGIFFENGLHRVLVIIICIKIKSKSIKFKLFKRKFEIILKQ